MRELQLEYGAEIGRAVVNFRGPIVFCVVSRYHGGAFVVFSKHLNENLEVAALEGSFASVIGGAPAAAVVFARDVDARTAADPRVRALGAELAQAAPPSGRRCARACASSRWRSAARSSARSPTSSTASTASSGHCGSARSTASSRRPACGPI